MTKWESFVRCVDPEVGCIICGIKTDIRYSSQLSYPVCEKDSRYSEEELVYFAKGKKIDFELVKKTMEKYNCSEQQARIMLAKMTSY